MKRKTKKYFTIAGVLLLLFIIFTCFVNCFDVKPIGPDQTLVGFATINRVVFQQIGVHLIWYKVTDWLGLAAIVFPFGFAIAGLCQWIKRKRIEKVDKSLLVLGGFYLLVVGCYLFFERVIINYRPVILHESPEASYPSSHTMIVICIMVTARIQLRILSPGRKRLHLVIDILAFLLISITVIGRLLSGVHWITDIVGGVLLSSVLIALYCAAVEFLKEYDQ